LFGLDSESIFCVDSDPGSCLFEQSVVNFQDFAVPSDYSSVLSFKNGWPLRQMDVNNAFLHDMLSETVYMMQPPGFKNLSKPNYVCRLRKVIYDLKQAPRVWYLALRSSLLQIGF
jgi:hypothetical protein